jgi:tRNA(Ile)-lysidine synthase
MTSERTRANREVARVLRSVHRDVVRRRLFPTGVFDRRHVVVACSGGGDSVALARILARLRRELAVSLVLVGIDHGLRPEAAGELDLVEALGRELEVPFERVRVTLDLHGRSVQAAAREARYSALREVATRTGASRIAVGHTLDDQAETVLAAALRGKSLSALRGIAWHRADGVVRPLLGQRRATLRAWLAAGGHPYVDDPSNEDPRYERVQIRALGPAIEAIDPRAAEHLAGLAEEARWGSAAVRAHARRWRIRAETGEGLRLSVLRAASSGTRRELLRGWLEELGPARSGALAELDGIVRAGHGRVVLGEGRGARIEAGVLRADSEVGITRHRRRTKSRSPRGDD